MFKYSIPTIFLPNKPSLVLFITLQLIYVGEYTKALNKTWHLNHFCCWQCNILLTNKKYIVINDHPFCQKCYNNIIANVCRICRQPIGPECKDLYVRDRHYHGKCLVCVDCNVSLVSSGTWYVTSTRRCLGVIQALRRLNKL